MILKDYKNILKDFTRENTEKLAFKEYFAIGTWCLGAINNSMLLNQVIKRYENIFKTDITLDKTDTLMIFSIYPELKNYHLLEVILPIARRYGWRLIKEQWFEWQKTDKLIYGLAFEQVNDFRPIKILKKHKLWDYVISYTDKGDSIMVEAVCKIVGITMEDSTRRLARQIIKKYPELKYGKGKRPTIRLKPMNFKKGVYEDRHAVAVLIKDQDSKKEYQIGWLGKNLEEVIEGTEAVPNEFFGDFLKSDEKTDDKIIQNYKIHTFGSFTKDGKELYYGKILFNISIENIEKVMN